MDGLLEMQGNSRLGAGWVRGVKMCLGKQPPSPIEYALLGCHLTQPALKSLLHEVPFYLICDSCIVFSSFLKLPEYEVQPRGKPSKDTRLELSYLSPNHSSTPPCAVVSSRHVFGCATQEAHCELGAFI